MASLTFDMAPACDPGDPDGTEIGDDPIGGCPDSEGGIMFGKGESLASRKPELLPTTALVLATGHDGPPNDLDDRGNPSFERIARAFKIGYWSFCEQRAFFGAIVV